MEEVPVLDVVVSRLARFGEDVRLLEQGARETAPRLARESREVLELFNAAEARHVGTALAQPGFAFEEAQRPLGDLLKSFARIVRDLLSSASAQLSRPQVIELDQLAFLAERSPLTSVSDLEVIRASMLAIESRRRALDGARA